MKKSYYISCIITIFTLYAGINAQTLPPILTFNPEDYGADNQNWQISQADNKYIYVANNKGLLEFNGANWHLYPSPNNTIIRSVEVIEDKIYTGCYMEFGFWMKNDLGNLEYTSLSSELDDVMKEDEQIWHIISYNEWVIFQSFDNIYLYNTVNKSFNIISSEKLIYKIFKIENTIYYNVRNEGVFKIEDGKPKLIISDAFIKNSRIANIFQVEDNLVLLTRESGFYKYENNRTTSWDIPANKQLVSENIFSGLQLSDGSFVIGTISNGIIHINSEGIINYKINQGNGLRNNTVLALFLDHDNNVWAGLDGGINCINMSSPFEVFNDFNGDSGAVYSCIVFNDFLYVGTNQGLFYKDVNSKEALKFIEGTGGQVWSLYNYNNEDILCGHHLGTFLIEKDKAHLIDMNLGSWTFKEVPNHGNLLLKGNYNGLEVLEKSSGSWKVRNKIKGFNNSSRFFELDIKNHVWVGHEYKGVFKLQLNDSLTRATAVKMEPTLKVGKNSSLIKFKNEILYAYEEGIYKYHDTALSFTYDSLLSPMITKEDYVSGKLVVDTKDRLWAFSKENIYYVTTDHLTNEPKINSIPIPLNLRKVTLSFENISLIRDNTYLLGTANGYITIDLSKIDQSKEYNIFLNTVTLKTLNDSIASYDITEWGEFNYKPGIITFDYSVPSYEKFLDVKYQYRLDGHLNKWSEWTNETRARFENLSFGHYTFSVRAKIGNTRAMNSVSYSFEVKRPWYLSNMSIIAYCIFLFFIAYLTHRAYKRHYKKKLKNEQSENEKLIMHIKNEQLNQDIESKNRELTISKMSIIKKNELLNAIKKELNIGVANQSKNVKSVIKLIDENLNNTKDWEFFVQAFNNTDKGFLDRLKSRHPNLTPNDIRFCVYLRMNLSSKEIAPLLNISVKSVETKRYRLRKRMSLLHEESLVNYIMDI